jgi:hypothetical protein
MRTNKTSFLICSKRYLRIAGGLEYALGFIFALFIGLAYLRWFNWENTQMAFQFYPLQTISQLSWEVFGIVTCGFALVGGACSMTTRHYRLALFGSVLMAFWLGWTIMKEFVYASYSISLLNNLLSAITFGAVTLAPSLISLAFIRASKSRFS